MAWCRGNTSSRNMYTTDVNANQLSGGQVIKGDFNGDGVEDTMVLGQRGQQMRSRGAVASRTASAAGARQSSAAFASAGGGYTSAAAGGYTNAASGGYANAASGGYTSQRVIQTASGSQSFAAGAAAGGVAQGGRQINVSQLTGGQVIKGDFNGDGIEDTMILGTRSNMNLGTRINACNAGPPKIAGVADLGTNVVSRGVVSRTQGSVQLQKVGYETKSIMCPATQIQRYKITVPVKKSKTIQVPEPYQETVMTTRQVPFTQEVRQKKWVIEDVQVPVHKQKTVFEDKPVNYSVPVMKSRLHQYQIDVPKQVKTTRKVTYQVNEPFTTYENRVTSRKVAMNIPQYAPKCDSTQVITSPVDLGGTMGHSGTYPGGMQIPINRLSGGQQIRGDFNGDGIEDKLTLR